MAVDVTAPSAPVFAFPLRQDGNTKWVPEIILPLVDSDGSELTGLTSLTVATMLGEDVSPFAGLGPSEISAIATKVEVVPLTPADAGTTKVVPMLVLGFGKRQYMAAWVSD